MITQNEDGLHRRAGLAGSRLSELHGNAFIEVCGRYASDDSDSDLGSSSSSDDDEETAARAAADEAYKVAARRRRPPGCGAAVARRFVTYYPDTYLRSNAKGRHVTGRACPSCRRPGVNGEVGGGEVGVNGKGVNGEGVNGEVGGGEDGGGEDGGGEVGGGEAGGSSTAVLAGENCPAGGQGTTASGDERPVGLRGRGWLLDSTVDFGEMPGGYPWGDNPVHNVGAAKAHMRRADLVVVWGSSLSILANYFDPWHPDSKWAKPPPSGLRLGPSPVDLGPSPVGADASSSGAGGGRAATEGGAAKRPRRKRGEKVAPCHLVIINQGEDMHTCTRAHASTKVPPPTARAALARAPSSHFPGPHDALAHAGKTLDEDLATLKIAADVDVVAEGLLRHLGLPPPPPYDPAVDSLLATAVTPPPGEPVAPWQMAEPEG